MVDRPEDQKDPTDAPSGEHDQAVEGDAATQPTAAERVIAQFGGIRPMAHKLGVPVTTVQGWKTRSAIPDGRHAEIRAAAATHGIVLSEADLQEAAGPREGEAESEALPEPAHSGDDTAMPSPVATGEVPAVAAMVEPAASRQANAGPARDRDDDEDRHDDTAALLIGAAQARRGGGIGWLALLVAIVALVGTAFAPAWAPSILPDLWAPQAGGPADTADVAALSDRVAALEQSVAAIAAAPAGERPAAGAALQPDGGTLEALAALGERLDSLEDRIGDTLAAPQATDDAGADLNAIRGELAAVREAADAAAASVASFDVSDIVGAALDPMRTEVTGLRSRVDSLDGAVSGLSDRLSEVASRLDTTSSETAEALAAVQDRLGSVEGVAERVNRGIENDQALALAYSQLRNDLGNSGPFAVSLATVDTLVAADPELSEAVAAIADRAASGIPTRAALAARFPDLARSVLAADGSNPDPDWLDMTLESLSELVTIRRAPGMVAGEETDAILARAEFNLRSGDLAAAVGEMEALTGQAAEAAAGWMADARARLAADAALARLGQAVLDRLSGTSGGEAAQ
ncbi:MAG: hypothetical protein H6843_17265 [Rhodospirillaceae bacterium]|nr:hypothetical protein [Rhodospirillaceae bacterium]